MKAFLVISALAVVVMASSCKKDSMLKQAVNAPKKDSTALKVIKASKPIDAPYDYQKAIMAKRTSIN